MSGPIKVDLRDALFFIVQRQVHKFKKSLFYEVKLKDSENLLQRKGEYFILYLRTVWKAYKEETWNWRIFVILYTQARYLLNKAVIKQEFKIYYVESSSNKQMFLTKP